VNLVPLSQVCRIVNGGTPKSGVADYWGGDVAWLTPAEMGKLDAPEIESTVRTITDAGLKNSSAKQVPAGSVILSTRAPIGHLAIPLEPMAFNQGCRGLVPSDKLDTKYLYYFLWFSREALNDLGTGTTFKELSSGSLGAYKIPLPPLEEQRRIVAVLDEAFAAIATATANAEKNLTNAQRLFEAELKAVLEGVDGEPASFGTTTDIKVGFAFKSAGYSNDPNDIPLIRGDNVVQGQLRWKDLKRWPRSDTTQYDAYRLAAGDVVLAMDRTWVKAGLKYAVISPDDVPSLLLQRVARLRANKTTSSDFVALQIASPAFTEYVLGIQTGLGVPHISGKQIADYCFPLPDLQRQDEIVRRVSEIREASDQLMALYASRLRSLEHIKQSLLLRAFSGELTEREPLAA
jgi:type I restriction enzyme, S subunit